MTEQEQYRPDLTAAQMGMQDVYNWLFHFNVYNNTWAAIPRDLVGKYLNDPKTQGVLFSRELDTLVDLILRTGGDEESIDELLKNQ
jgi:hypothetical protein